MDLASTEDEVEFQQVESQINALSKYFDHYDFKVNSIHKLDIFKRCI